MLRMRIILALLLLSFIPMSLIGADTHFIDNAIQINQAQDLVNPSKKVSVFEDKTHSQDIVSIAKLSNDRWSSLPGDVANFGFSKSAFWFKLNINNDGSAPLDLYLNIDYPLID